MDWSFEQIITRVEFAHKMKFFELKSNMIMEKIRVIQKINCAVEPVIFDRTLLAIK